MPLTRVARLALAASVAACAPSEQFDVLVRGGTVIDGTGSPAVQADLGIRGDEIATVGDLSGAEATIVVDATGLTVAPGFIDMHSHSDRTLLVDGRALSKVHQGVTTELVGESGSVAPVLGDRGDDVEWTTFAEYFERIEQSGISVNLMTTVASGTLRGGVVGYDDVPATPEQLAAMKAHVRQAMEDGAWGVSSGLIYVPDRFSRT
ncbi:MAG: amidohydrolase family protein, partial [Actinobacteria bacterium]|nr:amidohydrolase family protein [Actinomycetota bacterium]